MHRLVTSLFVLQSVALRFAGRVPWEGTGQPKVGLSPQRTMWCSVVFFVSANTRPSKLRNTSTSLPVVCVMATRKPRKFSRIWRRFKVWWP